MSPLFRGRARREVVEQKREDKIVQILLKGITLDLNVLT